MDESSTQIINEAADIVLLDDRFTIIVVAIRWGRAIFGNIHKFTD